MIGVSFYHTTDQIKSLRFANTETETETDSSETTTDETSEEVTEEQSTEGGDNETDTAVSNIPELMENKLEFTLELTETVYTTESDRINYRITSREPGGYIVRGDQWLLYRIENDKANLIGEIAWETAIEYIANDDEEYITRDEYLTIKMLCGKENLDVGEYCLVYPIQLPDNEGIYHRYAGAIMYFEVVE